MVLITNKQEVTMMTLQIQHKVHLQNQQQPPATTEDGTKHVVTIKVDNIDPQEGEDWANEIVNVYADMQGLKYSDISMSFQAGLSGMNDTTPGDIELKINEYITMNEAFAVQ